MCRFDLNGFTSVLLRAHTGLRFLDLRFLHLVLQVSGFGIHLSRALDCRV